MTEKASTKITRAKGAARKAIVARANHGVVVESDARFREIIALIEAARVRAYQAVNAELVSLYWQLGEYISRKIASAEWGDGVVEELASSLAQQFPGLRGFTRPNLFRMRQFYEAYRSNRKVSALLRQLPWTHHLIILGQARPAASREFYILAAVRESSRELERQIRSGAVLRDAHMAKKVSAALRQIHPGALDELKNAYNLEFLALPDGHSEADLHGALLRHLGRFLTELGRDFCFVGSQYPVQVGNQDFAIDLVFFHRALQCLVAFELKVEKFKPADLGQLSFYVEALDRNVKKSHERPSIGVLLCATEWRARSCAFATPCRIPRTRRSSCRTLSAARGRSRRPQPSRSTRFGNLSVGPSRSLTRFETTSFMMVLAEISSPAPQPHRLSRSPPTAGHGLRTE